MYLDTLPLLFNPHPIPNQAISQKTRVSPAIESKIELPYLSEELLLKIFTYLPFQTLSQCAPVCRSWHRIANDASLWTVNRKEVLEELIPEVKTVDDSFWRTYRQVPLSSKSFAREMQIFRKAFTPQPKSLIVRCFESVKSYLGSQEDPSQYTKEALLEMRNFQDIILLCQGASERMSKERSQQFMATIAELKEKGRYQDIAKLMKKYQKELDAIKGLHLAYNNLLYLPPEIGLFTNLENLNLTGNQLRKLPREIGQLTHLKELWLDNNQLCELPEEIGQLTALEKLCLIGNPLDSLPRGLAKLEFPISYHFSFSPEKIRKIPNDILYSEKFSNNPSVINFKALYRL